MVATNYAARRTDFPRLCDRCQHRRISSNWREKRVIRAGEAFREPGGDVIHYRAANNLADQWSRFVAVMVCLPGQSMLTFVDDDELAARRSRRVVA